MLTNLIQVLEETAFKYPNKIALEDQSTRLNYSDYMFNAKKIGAYLSDVCNEMNRPIIVMVGRNIESIVLFMGVLYSGNIYVPVDEKMPMDRLNTMIDKVKPVCILATEKQASSFANTLIDLPIYTYEEMINGSEDMVSDLPYKKMIDTDPAYIIFTSGSTGQPKGIAVSHVNVLDLMTWLETSFDFVHEDVIGNQTPFYFDASVKDIYIAMKKGATLCIIPQLFFMFPIKLMEYLNDRKVSSILWATSAMNLVAKSKVFEKAIPEYLNKIFFAGEAMYGKTINLWQTFIPKALYVNLYGPTEATVDATYYVVNRSFEDDEAVPIGHACENMSVFFEGDHDTSGEMIIRGKAVALGYYNDPEKTSEVFVQNPRHDHYRDIVYRSGDLAKYNAFGELVFMSRKDFQIKHKGYRIELGDIEMMATSHDSVLECICLYSAGKQQMILVYSGDINVNDLRKYLLSKLPKYMIPESFILLTSLPHNRNEKIDRTLLTKQYCEVD